MRRPDVRYWQEDEQQRDKADITLFKDASSADTII